MIATDNRYLCEDCGGPCARYSKRCVACSNIYTRKLAQMPETRAKMSSAQRRRYADVYANVANQLPVIKAMLLEFKNQKEIMAATGISYRVLNRAVAELGGYTYVKRQQEAREAKIAAVLADRAAAFPTPIPALRSIRTAAGLSLKQLATKAGCCTFSAIGHIEVGRNIPSKRVALALAAALAVDLAQLQEAA
jgi:DNA-binding XRE family transcriptional regulator